MSRRGGKSIVELGLRVEVGGKQENALLPSPFPSDANVLVSWDPTVDSSMLKGAENIFGKV